MTAWIPVVGWTLIHFLWQGLVVGLVAGVVLRLCRATSPGLRYVVACATLIVLAALPLTTAVRLAGEASGAPVADGVESLTIDAARPASVEPAMSSRVTLPLRSGSSIGCCRRSSGSG